MIITRALILLPILSLTAAAQTPMANHAPASKWESVKMLAPGTQIRVAVGTAKPTVGALESITDTDLVLTQGTGPQSFPRAQIGSVSVEKQGHRLRNALIGMGVGTAAGLGVGYGVGQAQGGWDTSVGTVFGGLVGFVGGTLTGVFWPTGGWRKIYVP